MRRAKLLSTHFDHMGNEMTPWPEPRPDERRDPSHARLRELMDEEKRVRNLVHAERLKLRR